MLNSDNRKHQLITWVEYVSEMGASPFWIVDQVQSNGFSRTESIEIYRLGTHGWSLCSEE